MKDYWHRFEQYIGSTKKCGYEDSMGEIRIPAIYDEAPYSIDGDLIPVAKGRKYGIINRDGECIINFEYDEVLILNEETFAVCKDSADDWSFTVINRASKQIIPNEYKHITRELRMIYNTEKDVLKVTSYSNFFKSDANYEIICKHFDEIDDYDKEKIKNYMMVFDKAYKKN